MSNPLRARVLRDTSNGNGLLSADGNQFPFTLEQHWRSDVAPSVNMTVDATFSADGTLLEVRAVSDAAISQEKVRATVDEAVVIATQTFGKLKETGTPVANAAVAKIGRGNLAAIVVLVIGWFFLNSISIQVTAGMKSGLTFFDMLRAVHSLDNLYALQNVSQASAGIYGLIGYLTIALCIAPFFIPHKKLWLGLASPLVFFVLVFVGIYWKISSAVSAVASSQGDQFSQMASGFAREMAGEMLKAISFGLGFYVSLAAALFLAYKGVTKYLAS